MAAPAITEFDAETLEFTVQYTQDLALTDTFGPDYFRDYHVNLIGTDVDGVQWLTCGFTLRLKNPCVDPHFVSISQPSLPVSLLQPITYTLFDSAEDYTHNMFEIVTEPIEHSLCGDFELTPGFNGDTIDDESRPLSYD